MEIEEFSNEMKKKLEELQIKFDDEQIMQFYEYMNLLIEWNAKINLTTIIEPNEIIQKHFIDSLTIEKFIENNSKVIDVGTGAGFPGIPLKIVNNSLNITLLDSLNKRISFLHQLIQKIDLNGVNTIHGRVEDIANNTQYRETFEIATSRAVASLNVLLEYLLPLVKVGGKCICMKGSNIEEELNNSKKALKLLGGKIEKIEELVLPNSYIKRNIIIVTKETNTPNKYPRKAGTPTKNPII